MSNNENFNGIWFLVQQALNKISTNTLVKVISYTANPGGGLLSGTVNVQPLVNQVDPKGNATPHGQLYSLPYFRLQAGNSAIVIDPVAGDIGMAGFADHDISSVKSTAAQSNPGSSRRFDMSDGIYFGGIGSLNITPTEYLQMTGAGVNLVTPGPFAITASIVMHNGTDIGAAHRHPYLPGSGLVTDTGTPV
jgi:hypothetical protein